MPTKTLPAVLPPASFERTKRRLFELFRMGSKPYHAWFNGYAEITARCSNNNLHAYGLYVGIEKGVITRVGYTKGAGKARNAASTDEVHTSVAAFCGFIKGKRIEEALSLDMKTLLGHYGCWDGRSQGSLNTLAKSNPEDLVQHKSSVPDALFSLALGGGLPYVLLNWVILNYTIKSELEKIVGDAAQPFVRFKDAAQALKLVDALKSHPALGPQRRAMEIGVRALQFNSVDDSSLRLAYQRHTFEGFAKSAAANGFHMLDRFLLLK
jgi:hypothetical protein